MARTLQPRSPRTLTDRLSVLDESDLLRVVAEAPPADDQVVLADHPAGAAADAAAAVRRGLALGMRVPDGFVRHGCGPRGEDQRSSSSAVADLLLHRSPM